MTDTQYLEDKIKDSGLMKKFLAEKLGITPYALSLKIKNKNPFKVSEVEKLCELLKITSLVEKQKIFCKK